MQEIISALENTDCHGAVAVVISAHGDENGLQVDKLCLLDTKKIFDTLEMNANLLGKPKIVILDACRTGKGDGHQHGMTVSEATIFWGISLSNETLTSYSSVTAYANPTK